MTIGFRTILIIISILTMVYMIRKIRYSKLQIEYAIFWIGFSAMLILMSIFSKAVSFFTYLLGIQSPVNFVFLSIIFILIIKVFFMTIELSQLENRLKELTQEFSISEKLKEDKKEKDED